MKRSIVSVCIGASFFVLAVTGLYAFFLGYTSTNMFIHVLFGWLFVLGVLLHLTNNLKALVRYLPKINVWYLPVFFSMLIVGALVSFRPIVRVNDWYSTYKTGLPREVSDQFVRFELDEEPNLEVEVLAGEQFWFPQVAIWAEDDNGNFLKTLMVTYSTAKGVFYGDRTKKNFKTLDKQTDSDKEIIRLDALPYWSHKRGVKAKDGLFSPSQDEPLTDAFSGATPQGNFKLTSKLDSLASFRILMEVNVAFDDNEFYSEFDFAEDTLYHSGAGLLGQPSLVYRTNIRSGDDNRYYMMDLVGRGHHSGQTGELYQDLSGITTAKQIIDRVIVRYDK